MVIQVARYLFCHPSEGGGTGARWVTGVSFPPRSYPGQREQQKNGEHTSVAGTSGAQLKQGPDDAAGKSIMGAGLHSLII